MRKLNDLEYLKLSKSQAFWYNVKMFFCSIPSMFKKFFLLIWGWIKGFGIGIW